MLFSARHFDPRRASWLALVFWVWLSGLVVSFALGDAFHAPSCHEQVRLHWAGHSDAPTVQPAALHVSKAEIECAACAFGLASLAVLVVLAWNFGAREVAAGFAPRFSCCGISLSAAPIARGPPRWARA